MGGVVDDLHLQLNSDENGRSRVQKEWAGLQVKEAVFLGPEDRFLPPGAVRTCRRRQPPEAPGMGLARLHCPLCPTSLFPSPRNRTDRSCWG